MRKIFLLLTVVLCALAFNASARFLSTDPLRPDQKTGANFNRYYYANNNPYRYIDPDGREDRLSNWVNRKLGVTPPPRSPEDWLGPALGYAMSGMLLATPDPSDVAAVAIMSRFMIAARASKGIGQALRYIGTVATRIGPTGGRAGRRTVEYSGSGGKEGAEKMFNQLTGGKSSARGNSRLGSLGDGSNVQMSTKVHSGGVVETSVRITSNRTGSHIKDIYKVRFKGDG